MQRFIGKNVLVTGAASGIGRAAAVRLAKEGASLALLDRSQEGLDETAHSIGIETGARVVLAVCDVADFDGIGKSITELACTLNGLHAVSHNAGIMRLYRTHEMNLVQWEEL